MACSLDLTVGAELHTLLTLPVNSIVNVALYCFKEVLAEVKRGCAALFGLLHPHSLPDTKGVLSELGERDSTKVTSTNPSRWELICSEFSDVLEKPGTPPARTIKHETDLLPDSVLPAKR